MAKLAAVLVALALALPALAQDAQTILHLLDYIAVDYAEAVADGRVKNEDEYGEMLEFTSRVAEGVAALPDHPQRAKLVAEASSLAQLVRDKALPERVSQASAQLRWSIVDAYALRLVPRRIPSLDQARKLYATQCASCHGSEGRGDGPAARGLEPAPSNFHDAERMAKRSVYGLYNTISLGVDGTAMPAFRALADDARWSLALLVSTWSASQAQLDEGERRWKAGERLTLDTALTLSPAEVTSRFGPDAVPVQHYLSVHPELLAASGPAPIAIARSRLAEAQAAYDRGDRNAAREAAMTAYLEGFELAEAALSNVDAELVRTIEHGMQDIREAIDQGQPPAALVVAIERVEGLLDTAETRLDAGRLSQGAAFTSSALILLREGLEAILVLAAIIAVVVKTGRRALLRWIHAGWAAALALGAGTWWLATFVVRISGANRELTEGFTALAAAVVLLYVGYWLHARSTAEAWRRFIDGQVGEALSARTGWTMAAVSFLAVYRELFEIVLFYQALWAQTEGASREAVFAGIAVALVALGAIGFAVFRYSVRLPIGPFFSVTSLILAALAVVFTGQGIAALQEAGVVTMTRVGWNGLPALGVHGTVEGLAAQALALLLVVCLLAAARRGRASQPMQASG